jgi:16S rRNA (uracil1498-N3)-methyltransferase
MPFSNFHLTKLYKYTKIYLTTILGENMSDLRRFFLDSKIEIGDTITMGDEEFRHVVNVLRAKVGESILLCDNTGYEYTATITAIEKKSLTAKVEHCEFIQTEPKNKVVLIAGYLKGDKTELVVQKAVELGVNKIVVFNSKFCSAFMNDNKLARLNKVSVEASKQCGRAIAPSVEYADNFSDALQFGVQSENKLFACEFATKNEVDFNNLQGDTAIVVGSEGGFSRSEEELANAKGFASVTLGKRILRAETAAVALTSVVMFSLGELR